MSKTRIKEWMIGAAFLFLMAIVVTVLKNQMIC